ncbi:hypothetical protein Tco_0983022 [Tanacetum coccineum]
MQHHGRGLVTSHFRRTSVDQLASAKGDLRLQFTIIADSYPTRVPLRPLQLLFQDTMLAYKSLKLGAQALSKVSRFSKSASQATTTPRIPHVPVVQNLSLLIQMCESDSDSEALNKQTAP